MLHPQLLLGKVPPAFSDQNDLATIGDDTVAVRDVVRRADTPLRQIENKRKRCLANARKKLKSTNTSWRDRSLPKRCEVRAQKARFRVLKRIARTLVHRGLIRRHTDIRSIRPDTWLKRRIRRRTTPVSDTQARRWYRRRRRGLRGSYRRLKARIKRHLTRKRRRSAYHTITKRLEDTYDVSWNLPSFRVSFDHSGTPGRGPDTAPVTLVEFSDFQCPYCRRFQSTIDRVYRRYRGRIRHVFRHFPLQMHEHAMTAAEASLCAQQQGRFWTYHDRLFSQQNKLATDMYVSLAQNLDLEMSSFKRCLREHRQRDRVRADYRAGVRAGVEGTPTVFINGRPVNQRSFSRIQSVIEEELRRSR